MHAQFQNRPNTWVEHGTHDAGNGRDANVSSRFRIATPGIVEPGSALFDNPGVAGAADAYAATIVFFG